MINIEDFQSLIDNYEETIGEISKELNAYRTEQNNLKLQINSLLIENKELTTKLANRFVQLSNDDDNNCQYRESDFIKNLQQQLNHVVNEKDNVVKLWQNSCETIERLEEQLKCYNQNDLEDFVPKQEFVQLKLTYDEKIKQLENLLKCRQNPIEIVDKQCCNCNENNLKTIQNLEDEIVKLEHRLNDCNQINKQLEINLIDKNDEIHLLAIKNQECCLKVQEAVMIVEGALSERDAAVLRESGLKDEIANITDVIEETAKAKEKLKNEIEQIHAKHDEKLKELQEILKESRREIGDKNKEIEKLTNDLKMFEKHDLNDNSLSKLLILEKNLENTFQKLLLSEKQNIQLRSENESIKNDLDQMSSFYERDVKKRDVEKIQLKNNLKQLEIELNETRMKLNEIYNNNEELKINIATIENNYQLELDQQKQLIEDNYTKQINQLVKDHNDVATILKQQLLSQKQLNNKWRTIIIEINQIFDKRLLELKQEIIKLKEHNKSLIEKLKSSTNRINEYKQLLQTITKNVGNIVN